MNRDNVLYVVIGILIGFIAAYFMFEMASTRQPAPAQAQAQVGTAGAMPQGAPNATGAPMMIVQELRARVEENPNDLEAVRELANMNYDINNWGRAAELYERALALDPGNIDSMTDLGACYRNLGRSQDALRLFKEVRQIDPDHWQSRFNEILILAFDLGDLSAAAAETEALQALQPNNPDVQRLADEIARRMNST